MQFNLSQDDIQEFKRIVHEEYNRDLTDEEAIEQANNILSLFNTVMRIDAKNNDS